jgi:hypothetical protein
VEGLIQPQNSYPHPCPIPREWGFLLGICHENRIGEILGSGSQILARPQQDDDLERFHGKGKL